MIKEKRKSQSSLAGGEIDKEEKLQPEKKVEMQKRYRKISMILVGIIIIASSLYIGIYQRCVLLGHQWQEASCIAPATCTVCGKTEGDALGHQWVAARCKIPKMCTVCGETEGAALGHQWLPADCVTAKTCSVCRKTEGNALGHQWIAATCTMPKVCSACGVTDGKALGHNWPENTTKKLVFCTTCNQPNGSLVEVQSDLLSSSWSDQEIEFSLKNGKKVGCTILLPNTKIEKCYSITLCLRINELIAGNVMGEWGFYIRDLNGQWHLADTFVLDGDYIEAHFDFDEPISFDAWACPCHVLGDNWSFSFSVWIQDATVFEYIG